jgi:hypothetical protein
MRPHSRSGNGGDPARHFRRTARRGLHEGRVRACTGRPVSENAAPWLLFLVCAFNKRYSIIFFRRCQGGSALSASEKRTGSRNGGPGGDDTRALLGLGASELPLRQGFACGKTLERRIRAAPLCGAPRVCAVSLNPRHAGSAGGFRDSACNGGAHSHASGRMGILLRSKCSGQVNCPCAKVLPAAKRLNGAFAPPHAVGPRGCARCL